VFDRERCEVRIRHEIAVYAGQRKQVAQDGSVPLGRLGRPYRLRREGGTTELPVEPVATFGVLIDFGVARGGEC
jgi:hypothetical protein